MAFDFSKLSITSANSAINSSAGALWNTPKSKLANRSRDTNRKFYYDYYGGDSVIHIVARHLLEEL